MTDERAAAAPIIPLRQRGALIEVRKLGKAYIHNGQALPVLWDVDLHLEPGEGSLDELIAGVDEGVFLQTNKSWSIDDKRLNFQFGTQIAWEIRDGKLGRTLRDATYTGITPQFWGSLDGVAGRDAWRLQGLTNCGKGQPGQHAHVSHGTSAGRFRKVQVGVRDL